MQWSAFLCISVTMCYSFAYFLFREYRIRLDNVTLKNFVFLAFALTFYYICTSFYAFFIIKQYIMKKTILLFFAFLMALSVQAQSVDGSWTGKLSVGGTQLTIVLNITKGADGKFACTLDSPDQGVKGIPADITVTDETKVKVSIANLMATYEGEVKDGEMKGTFTQGGMPFTLNLKPGTVKLNRPQTPVEPYPYATKEVKIDNKADNVSLGATLTYPVGYEKMDKKDVPVVVMVTGSGLQNRDEELFGHKPFLVLADYLARNGIATLRYDDRGMDKSTGNPATATVESNMRDALAAVEAARGMGEFGKVGVLGHSEGGLIAFMLGAQGKADFIVSMAGPGVGGDSILLTQNRRILTQSGMPAGLADGYCKALKGILTAMAGTESISDPNAKAQEIVKQTGVNLPAPAVANLAKVIESGTPWLKSFISYDPTGDIKAQKCPVMAVNGSKDMQVIADENLSAIRGLLPANKMNVVKEYDGLNHLFQHCTTGMVTEYNQIEETMSPEVMQDIAGWINKVK